MRDDGDIEAVSFWMEDAETTLWYVAGHVEVLRYRVLRKKR